MPRHSTLTVRLTSRFCVRSHLLFARFPRGRCPWCRETLWTQYVREQSRASLKRKDCAGWTIFWRFFHGGETLARGLHLRLPRDAGGCVRVNLAQVWMRAFELRKEEWREHHWLAHYWSVGWLDREYDHGS